MKRRTLGFLLSRRPGPPERPPDPFREPPKSYGECLVSRPHKQGKVLICGDVKSRGNGFQMELKPENKKTLEDVYFPNELPRPKSSLLSIGQVDLITSESQVSPFPLST